MRLLSLSFILVSLFATACTKRQPNEDIARITTSATNSDGGDAKIELEKDFYDLDTLSLSRSDTLSFMVGIRNSGDNVLQILEIQPSCECLSVECDKKELKKGESVELKATLHVKGIQERGMIMRDFTIHSNAEDSVIPVFMQVVIVP